MDDGCKLGHYLKFFMTQPPGECALMQRTIANILANRTDVSPPAKKERKKKAPKDAQTLLPLSQ